MYFIEDTNVVSTAARDPESDKRLEKFRREQASEGFCHAVSPLLLLELLEGLTGSSREHFPSDQLRFKKAIWSPTTILPLPGDFALRKVLGYPSPIAPVAPEHIKEWVDVVCNARDWDELINGDVVINASTGRTHGVNFKIVSDQRAEYRRSHSERMKVVRQAGGLQTPTSEWTIAFLKTHGILLPNEKEIAEMTAALDAAHRHDRELLRLAAQTDYKFERDMGAPMDGEYLIYLADPGTRFVTHDARIKERAKGSPQASQIIVLPQ